MSIAYISPPNTINNLTERGQYKGPIVKGRAGDHICPPHFFLAFINLSEDRAYCLRIEALVAIAQKTLASKV